MAKVLERKSSSSLFKETAHQRFRRESLEIWEKIQTDEKEEEEDTTTEAAARNNASGGGVDLDSVKAALDALSSAPGGTRTAVRRTSNAGGIVKNEGSNSGVGVLKTSVRQPKQSDPTRTATRKEEIFPKKVKSSLVKTQPALWETEKVDEENKVNKKEPTVKERKSRSKDVKPVRRIGDKIPPSQNIRKI